MMKQINSMRQLALSGSFGLFLTGLASAGTLIVDQGGAGDYLTIQAAIDNALAGDTIVVSPGTYIEDLIIPVSVTLTGAGVGQCIVLPATSIQGAGLGSQVETTTWLARVQASNVTITGFTFDGNNPALPGLLDARGGIIADYSVGTFDDIEIVNCEVKNVLLRGIALMAGGVGHRVISNTVSNVKQDFFQSIGITMFGAVGEADGNVVTDCSIGMGFHNGGGGSMSGNTVTFCDLGIFANGSASPILFSSNTITDSDQGLQGVALQTSASFVNNTIERCNTGVSLFGGGPGLITVDGNSIDGEGVANTYGLWGTSDLSPWGFGDLNFLATSNLVKDTDYAVVLEESLTDLTPVISAVLGGSPTTYNTFMGSASYNLFMDLCNDNVTATQNEWGAVTAALIENTVHHQVDDPTLGLVDFSNPVGLYVTVDDDGPADFTTINPAVQALMPGGTIFVMPGLYVEDVLVDRSCLIQGSGTSTNPVFGTVLRGASISPTLNVVEVTGPDVFIDNLRVDGQVPVYTHAYRAIYGNGTSGLTVSNCVVHTARTTIGYVSSTDGLFVNNEVYAFGENLQAGGGIFFWNSTGIIGLPGQGNWVHDGLATAILFHQSSSGQAYDNLAENAGLGYLSNGAVAATLFEGNRSVDSNQHYQGLGNNAPVTYVDNEATGGSWAYTLFGLGGQLHTYLGNRAIGVDQGWSILTESIFGDDDAVAYMRGNTVTGCDWGIILEETVSSNGFLMDVDLRGGSEPNWIQGNTFADLYMLGCNDDIDISGNYLGSTIPAQIETQVFHQVDDPSLGLFDFSGALPSFVYCTPKVASAGCVPSIASSGTSSMTSPSPFMITATDIVSQKFGLLFYGFARGDAPFLGGTLCVQGSIKRTTTQHSGGSGTENCTGSFAYDMNALIQGGSNAALVAGTSVFAQYWFRDPAQVGSAGVGLSDAITFTIEP